MEGGNIAIQRGQASSGDDIKLLPTTPIGQRDSEIDVARSSIRKQALQFRIRLKIYSVPASVIKGLGNGVHFRPTRADIDIEPIAYIL